MNLFTKFVLLLCFVTCLFSCMRLRPLCITKNDKCGCDHSKNIPLSQQTKGKIPIRLNSNFIIFLNKKKTIKVLRRHTSDKNEKLKIAAYTIADTITIDGVKTNFPPVRKFMIRQIKSQKAVITNSQTGEKLPHINQRKYNLQCKDARYGQGAVEYSSPDKKVIIKRLMWAT